VPVRRINGLLDGVDYHQFYLTADDPDEYPQYPAGGPPNRLLATTDADESVCVSTGIAMGVIRMAIEFLDAPPAQVDDSREWEAIAEVSYEATATPAKVLLLMSSAEPPFRSFELPSGPGWYRVRGHALGRALDFDLAVREAREHHLLQLWTTDGFADPTEIRADDPWANQTFSA